MLERELEKQEVVIGGEEIDEGWFCLRLENASVYVSGVKVATVKEIKLFTLLLYSSVSLDEVVLDSSLKAMAPESIPALDISYLLLTPFSVGIDAEGKFGQATGEADIRSRSVKILFDGTEGLGGFSKNLTKSEEGWQYETSF